MNKYIPYFPLLFSIIYELMKRNIVQYVSCFTSLQCYGNHCNLQYLTSFIYDARFIRKSSVLTSSNFWSKNIHQYVVLLLVTALTKFQIFVKNSMTLKLVPTGEIKDQLCLNFRCYLSNYLLCYLILLGDLLGNSHRLGGGI